VAWSCWSCTSPVAAQDGALGLRLPGQVIEQCAHNLGIPYPVSARTVSAAQIIRIPLVEVQKREQKDARAGAFLRRALSTDLYYAVVFITRLKSYTPADRVMEFASVLADVTNSEIKFGRRHVSMPVHDSQAAEILGLSPRQFKRVKRQLIRQGRLTISAARLWSFAERADCEVKSRVSSF